MLTIYRRHRANCKMKGRRAKCFCPIWVQGILHDNTIRESLGVTSWEAAQKICRDWEIDGKREILTVREAMQRFIADHERRQLSPETVKKFERLVKRMPDVRVDSITPDDLAKIVESWKLKPSTQQKQLERLKSFFRFCERRKWIKESPSKDLAAPREKGIDVKPFTSEELERIHWAIPLFPKKGIYREGNSARIKSFVNCLRWTGLRIRDVVQLKRTAVADGYITLRTQKNGKPVRLPIHRDIDFPAGGEYFFWSGEGNPKSCVGDWQRTLRRLSALSGVHIHAHRFRHTFAAELLSKGVPVSEVAAILGNTPRIVEKHYSQWISQRQKAIDEAIFAIWK
jgi:site-specific recombinase XerD